MLTKAQRKAGRIVLRSIEKYGTVLAGGAAMNEAGLIDRPTDRMDFVTNSIGADLVEISQRAAKALTGAGIEVTVMRSGPQFVKLLANAGRRSSFGFSQLSPTIFGTLQDWPLSD